MNNPLYDNILYTLFSINDEINLEDTYIDYTKMEKDLFIKDKVI